MADLKDKKLFLLDMDGTLYLDDRLFPGVKDFLMRIKEKGGKYVFLTNNSSRGVKHYVEKMESLGIHADREDFLTSVDALIAFLRLNYGEAAGGKKIYIMGTESFKEQMAEAGFNVTDYLSGSDVGEAEDVSEAGDVGEAEDVSEAGDVSKAGEDIEMLIIGFDRELTFRKLEDACILLGKDIDYIATNPDWVCPTSYGYVPDCGSFAWMLEKATGRKPKFIGKPEPDMALLALKKWGYEPEEALMIGDRLYTDIACGNNAGIDTVFVLSGEGTLEDLEVSSAKPTYVFSHIEEVLQAIE